MNIPFQDGCTVAEVTRKDGAVAPAIWVGGYNTVSVLPEPLALAFYLFDLQRSYGHIKSVIGSIANLVRYYISLGRPDMDERGLRKFIESYIVARSVGNPDFCWSKMSRNSLETEVRNIAEYSDFCEKQFVYLPILNQQRITLPPPDKSQRSFWRLMACNETDFFSHLAILREGDTNSVPIPGRASRRGEIAGGSIGMSEDFAFTLIEAEKNPTFKAIWLLGFFGGPRLSESLNLWACDVLPGTFREHWFRGDTFVDLPLVIVADPWVSTWCGKLGDESSNREAFLLKKYGLHPRPRMSETEAGEFRGKTAGYKGSMPTNKSLNMRHIYWVNVEAALLFERTFIEVIQLRNRMPKARLHPFLFVNTDHRKPAIQGEMISMSNVRKAFERAVKRTGRTPYKFKQRPHGMRHLYKDLLELIFGRDDGAIQVCMGHWSRESQNAYGSLDMQAMRHAMAALAQKRKITNVG